MKNKLGAVLRGVLLILLSATVVMTLLGAVGTACLAWSGDKYGPAFRWIIPYMLNYQVVVYISLAAGVAGAIVAYAMVRGDRWFYIGALITLLVSGGAVAYQMYMTSTLRNIAFMAAAPANVRFIITLVTLIAFALVRLPGVWNKSGWNDSKKKPGSPLAAGGIALIVSGALLISAPYWAGPTHMLDGYNLVLTLEVPLLLDGIAMIAGGLGVIWLPKLVTSHFAHRRLISER